MTTLVLSLIKLGDQARVAELHSPDVRVWPDRSPLTPGRGNSFGPVRDGVGDRYRRGRPRACGRELLVVAGWVMRSIYRLAVLAEEFPALAFGEVSQDHQRIGGSSVGCVGMQPSLRSPAGSDMRRPALTAKGYFG